MGVAVEGSNRRPGPATQREPRPADVRRLQPAAPLHRRVQPRDERRSNSPPQPARPGSSSVKHSGTIDKGTTSLGERGLDQSARRLHRRRTVKITGAGAIAVTVKVNAFNPTEITRDSLQGFVEADGYVSIEAEHLHARRSTAAAARWEKIDDYGRTLSSMTISPATAASVTPPQNSPCLEYQMYLFNTGQGRSDIDRRPHAELRARPRPALCRFLRR